MNRHILAFFVFFLLITPFAIRVVANQQRQIARYFIAEHGFICRVIDTWVDEEYIYPYRAVVRFPDDTRMEVFCGEIKPQVDEDYIIKDTLCFGMITLKEKL